MRAIKEPIGRARTHLREKPAAGAGARRVADLRERGLFAVRVKEVDGATYLQTLVTPAGLIWLSERYPATDAMQVVVDPCRLLPLEPAEIQRGGGH